MNFTAQFARIGPFSHIKRLTFFDISTTIYVTNNKRNVVAFLEKRFIGEIISADNAHATLPSKLSIPQQIEHMKKKGVTFELYKETAARTFLAEHNYYFKLKAYAHNFDRYKDPGKDNRYINLDFAHLVDLSKIDAEFRKIILNMCLDLEHFLKVRMLNHCTMVDEDGYDIVRRLFEMQPDLKGEIEKKVNTSTCHQIVAKRKDAWAIWSIVELISFGPFIDLYNMFYSDNKFDDDCRGYLYAIKMIRNAAAHNNCLLNQMRAPYSRSITPSYELRNTIHKISSYKADKVNQQLQNPTTHDFLALLIVYSKIVPESSRTKGLEAAKALFNDRMLDHKDYYAKQQGLISTYHFVAEILNKLS